jgi:hypothetical protein
MSEPRTEAGKRLLEDDYYRGSETADYIVTIEAEAVAARNAEIAAAVRGLDDDCHSRSGLMCDRDDQGRCTSINRAAVLALVEKS